MSTEKNVFSSDNMHSAKSNWWKPEVGDRISGICLKKWESEAYGVNKPQYCYKIQTENGEFINVGTKQNDFFQNFFQAVVEGDTLGFERKEDVPSKTPGFGPAKRIDPYRVPGDGTVHAAETPDSDMDI